MESNTYILSDEIGSGLFGTIYKAIDSRTGTIYAVKIPKSDNTMLFSTVREISALMLLNTARNVVTIHEISYTLSPDSIHPTIVMELYDSDANNHLPQSHAALKQGMYDICNGMLSLYNRNLYHLDLKPNNILYKNKPEYGPYGRYFIADFGSSLKFITDAYTIHSCQIQNIFFRAPEVVYSFVCNATCTYNSSIDLWAIGIMMGMFANKAYDSSWQHPAFRGLIQEMRKTGNMGDIMNRNTEMLASLYTLYGKVPITSDTTLCPVAEAMIIPAPGDLRSYFPYMNDEEYDFMMMFQKMNPKQRPGYTQIFSHSWFNGLIPSEPVNMLELDKVKAMDWLQIEPFKQRGIYKGRVRTSIIEWLIRQMNKYGGLPDIYFRMIMLIDSYTSRVPHITKSDVQLIGVSAMTISTYTREDTKFTITNIQDLTKNKYTKVQIETCILDMLKLFNYSIHFSTEREYLDAYLNDMKLEPNERTRIYDEVWSLLVLASKNKHFRTWSKESIVLQTIMYFMGQDIDVDNLNMLQKLGIIPDTTSGVETKEEDADNVF